ncbi:MAG TPA: fibronectin type III domain-containing protein [Thermoanaerobaculia bacterium]|nr:fibronectin type III domain-containing protein [Thermoanaerobaculia bacterium]
MKLVVRALILALLSVLPLLAVPAGATTFQMVKDSTLADQAKAIVRAKVVGVEPSMLGDRPATDYIVEVERVLKGDLPGSTIVVRVQGGIRPDGVGLKIWGAPAMAEGESALLFLVPAEDGTFRVLHLMLGAFHRRASQGRGLALRDLSEAQEVRADGVGAATDEVRDFDRFADWIADRAAGVVRGRDYLVGGSGQPRSALDAFTFMTGDDDNAIRWFDFDAGRSISWRVNSGGQPGLGLDATVGAFNVALQGWNSDAATNIRYTYAGTTSASAGFDHSDDVNAILFEDPGDQSSEGSFECGSGGVIAVGGPWFYDSTRPYKGKSYHEAAEADIVTNDGTSCFFQDNPRVAEEVFAHELGHTLGLGHSQTRDALMYARAHDDGRGARLHADDRAAIAELYGDGAAASPSGPKAPTGLTASSVETTSAILQWVDNSKDETDFRVERKVGSGKFTEILTLEPDATEVTVDNLQPGTTYSFRVRASNASGISTYTNVVKIQTGGALAAPADLAAVVRSPQRVLLTWRDVTTGETGFRIERSVAGGRFKELTRTAPANATQIVLRGLTPGTTYRFRVRAVGTGSARSPYSAVVTVTTPPA